ncbi:YraN family protein [Antarcticibacterium sp. 1MA-6-2]|uniref:YraN family protein n=1 Tax=Antarcticibacterium sp. 1MA-6-2 TaxID=2908210 RepID=UPI001F486B1B|nr:YraN family protein [Antarcticibacterium sp. 1MA-6-2]UJH90458.1 YraN family protein [Antarcticibacterium sp. 1MA-6-2]
MAAHNELGKKGEDLAVEFLLKKGYEIVARNFIYQKAEVDIIARKDSILAIVEVKTRSTPDFGNPQEFLKGRQIQRLVKAVDHFVTANEMDVEVRFDIVAIIKNKSGTRLEHLEDAFLHFD